MTKIILAYITCESIEQARNIGRHLLNKRLCACVNIIPEMYSLYFWPPKSNKFQEGREVVLIAKTMKNKYNSLEKEVMKIHTYDTPCVIAIPTDHVNRKYNDWLVLEMKNPPSLV